MVQVDWKGQMVFEAMPPSGKALTMDAYPDAGGQDLGPTPLETMLSGLAACSAMDVISILQKKRQKVTSYRVEVEGVRPEPGVYPRPFTKLTIKHIVEGEDLDESAVAQAVKLSDEKYCSVIATFRANPDIQSVYEIVSPQAVH